MIKNDIHRELKEITINPTMHLTIKACTTVRVKNIFIVE